MKKYLLAFILVSCSTMSIADMPNMNNMTSEKSERITNGDLSCETRSPTPTINAGVYSSDNQRAYYNGVNEKDQGMYEFLFHYIQSQKVFRVIIFISSH